MHIRSDICIARSDGSEKRTLTTGQMHWFATSYGTPENHGGGSNRPQWSPRGQWITYTRCIPDSRTAWMYQTDKADTDHFNCAWRPDQAKGGTQICLIDINGSIKSLTYDEPALWNWRTVWSTSADHIVFARAAIGNPAELWIMNADGTEQRFLTRGFNDKGADFPNWITLTKN
jgi:Tol biopolymer transport system component